jgi:hypothetical protein
METEFDDDELGTLIRKWVDKNTVNGVYSLEHKSEDRMDFNSLRIPLYNADGAPIDMHSWTRDLSRYLRNKCNIKSEVISRGIGYSTVIIGE